MSASNFWEVPSTVWALQKKIIDEEISKQNDFRKINKAINNYKKLSEYFEILWGDIYERYKEKFPEPYVNDIQEKIKSIQERIRSIPMYQEQTKNSIVE